MSLSPTRPLTAAVLLTVLVTGCGAADKPAAGEQSSRTDPSTSQPATPSASPSTSSPATKPAPKGIDGLPAKAILAKTRAAAKTVRSVRIQARLTQDGQAMTMDVQAAPKGMHGAFSTPDGQFELIVLGRTVYAKASDKSLRSQAKSKAEGDAIVATLGGKWLMTTKPDADLQQAMDLGDPAKVFKELLRPAGTLKKTGPRTIAGVRCIGLHDGEGVLWVDAVTALPVRVESTGKKPDVFTFSRYGQVKAPNTPPKSQTIDSKAFEG